MTLYKIRVWVNKRVGVGRSKETERIHDFETMIVDRLDTARRIYGVQIKEINEVQKYVGVTGGCAELFVPEINPDGTISPWPKDKKYIERVAWGDVY